MAKFVPSNNELLVTRWGDSGYKFTYGYIQGWGDLNFYVIEGEGTPKVLKIKQYWEVLNKDWEYHGNVMYVILTSDPNAPTYSCVNLPPIETKRKDTLDRELSPDEYRVKIECFGLFRKKFKYRNDPKPKWYYEDRVNPTLALFLGGTNPAYGRGMDWTVNHDKDYHPDAEKDRLAYCRDIRNKYFTVNFDAAHLPNLSHLTLSIFTPNYTSPILWGNDEATVFDGIVTLKVTPFNPTCKFITWNS